MHLSSDSLCWRCKLSVLLLCTMEPKTSKQPGWLGLLMIAVLSGLVVKVVGDPIVQVLNPKVEDAAEEAEDFLDRDWGRQLNRWLKDCCQREQD